MKTWDDYNKSLALSHEETVNKSPAAAAVGDSAYFSSSKSALQPSTILSDTWGRKLEDLAS